MSVNITGNVPQSLKGLRHFLFRQDCVFPHQTHYFPTAFLSSVYLAIFIHTSLYLFQMWTSNIAVATLHQSSFLSEISEKKGKSSMYRTENTMQIMDIKIIKNIFPNGSGYDPFAIYSVYRSTGRGVKR